MRDEHPALRRLRQHVHQAGGVRPGGRASCSAGCRCRPRWTPTSPSAWSRRSRCSPRPSTSARTRRRRTVACSSAAGGLRVVCVGLVPEYTTGGRPPGRARGRRQDRRVLLLRAHRRRDSGRSRTSAPTSCCSPAAPTAATRRSSSTTPPCSARAGKGVHNIIVAGNKSAYDDVRALLRRLRTRTSSSPAT